MTQEEKELLIKDLCARLPYGVNAKDLEEEPPFTIVGFDGSEFIDDGDWEHKIESVKPYLRPMSDLAKLWWLQLTEWEIQHPFTLFDSPLEAIDYFLENHLDYRGLIPMGLALEAPEGMYKIE